MRAPPFLAAAFLTLVAGAEARAEGPVDELAHEMRDPCWDTFECRRNGRCTAEGDACVARSEEWCAASSACREDGMRCKLDADAGRCVSRLGQKVDPATTKKVAPPPGNEPDARPSNRQPVRDAGAALSILGMLGLGVGLVAGGLWEIAPEEDKEPFMIASLSGTIPGTVLVIPGIIMLHDRGDSPVYATVGPGSFRLTF